MMDKTLILKHISGMLCLLISYSKFTRTQKKGYLISQAPHCIIYLESESDAISDFALSCNYEIAFTLVGGCYFFLSLWLSM